MNATETRYYKALRRYWRETASRAFYMARSLAKAEDIGITFSWESETESRLDVFGEPCPNRNCRNPKCSYVHFNPQADCFYLVARYEDPETGLFTPLDSLGMIESPFDKQGFQSYRWYCEAEMAASALAELDRVLASRHDTETEETRL